MELYVKYRPKTCDEVLGNDLAIKSLRKEVEAGHNVFLLTGNSGCGKTTTARAIANEVGASDLTIHEINVSDDRGIGLARQIKEEIRYQPSVGEKSIYILDEIHNSTRDFQEAILKILEDCPTWCYFFLCTTNPEKLLDTLVGRCSQIQLQPLDYNTMFGLLRRVAHKEGIQVGTEVLQKIAEISEGSSRNGLKKLGQVIYLDNDEERMKYIEEHSFSEENEDIFKLCQALIKKSGWNAYAECIEKAKDDVKKSPEGVKFLIMSYARTVLTKGFNLNAAAMIKAFTGVDTWRNKEYAIWEGIIDFCELVGD